MSWCYVGENLASRGEIHEALVQFQKAKALLIIESQNNFSGQTNSRVTQILGEIMMKVPSDKRGISSSDS